MVRGRLYTFFSRWQILPKHVASTKALIVSFSFFIRHHILWYSPQFLAVSPSLRFNFSQKMQLKQFCLLIFITVQYQADNFHSWLIITIHFSVVIFYVSHLLLNLQNFLCILNLQMVFFCIFHINRAGLRPHSKRLIIIFKTLIFNTTKWCKKWFDNDNKHLNMNNDIDNVNLILYLIKT